MKDSTMILGSGVALGVYVPPLLLFHQLKNKYHVEFEVIESIFLDSKLEKIIHNKRVFHFNNRIAIKAHQKKIEYDDCYDEQKINLLFQYWKEKCVNKFIIFSGLWVPIIKKYERYIGQKVTADFIHMDAVVSNSWRSYLQEIREGNNVWLFSKEKKSVSCKIDLNSEYPVLPFCEREQKVTVHGGGWGMGTYMTKYEELANNGIRMNYILYYEDDLTKICETNNYYILDETWIPWNKSKEGFLFPPMLELDKKNNVFDVDSSGNKHEFYSILGKSKGVISKPGGGTLLDSLETETPVIFLDAVGEYEKDNANLWIELGFGYEYKIWKESGFSFELLEKASDKIRNYKSKLSNMEELLCSLKQM